MTHKLGALPPPGHEWELGKTAASVKFVNDATRLLNKGQPWVGCTKEGVDKLAYIIEQVKAGRRVINEWIDVNEFVRHL